jgi:hypothetical protein
MTILPETDGIDKAIEKEFERFTKRFKIKQMLKSVNAAKLKGFAAHLIFGFLLGLVFTHKNLYALLNTSKEKTAFEKDTAYRFLGKPNVRWETFVQKLGAAAVAEIDPLTSDSRKSALIIDDTPYYRDRSKKVEMLSLCYDHAQDRYYKGFTMLTMGWSDGQTFIPVDYRLLASGKDKNLLEGSHVKEDKRTIATKRRTDARTDKPSLVLNMLTNAKGTAVQTRYVLFDSWFASPSSLLSIHGLGYDVVARLKNNKNFRYLYQGQCLSIGQIYKMSRKRPGKSRYLLSVEVQVRHDDFIETIPAKIVFVRDRNNRKKWIALASTDVSLSEDEIIALYGKRWDIEPYHKILKSCLHLTNEFQLRSFDAIVAHAAIVLTRYIFLAIENRESKDERTLGELFLVTCDELNDISFAQAFALLVATLEQSLNDYLHLAIPQLRLFVEYFFALLPDFIKARLYFSLCES